MELLKRATAVLKTGLRTLAPNCREATRLQSEALDQPLPLPKRFGLRVHLLLCKWCRRYGKQIRFLRRAAHEHSEKLTESTPRALSPEARERLKHSLRDEPK